ncbi:unnamed protein product [Ectocarpus fasciculatus]
MGRSAPHHVVCATPTPVIYFSENIVFEDGMSAGYLHVVAGNFVHVALGTRRDAKTSATRHRVEFVDFGALIVSPGLIDAHVHVSAVGGRRWEGYDSASRAAVAGGTTTMITMPLNSIPPTTTVSALEMEVREALRPDSRLFTDVGFWGGGVPSNIRNNDLNELLSDSRVLGVKSFLSPLPPAAGYEAVSPGELFSVAEVAASKGVPLLVHCELMSVLEIDTLHATAVHRNKSRQFWNYLSTRPAMFEERAIKELVRILESVRGLRAHVVHLSDAGSLSVIEEAKQRNPGRFTAETCPHYLFFSADTIPDGETRLKCMPPIRPSDNRETLWKGLRAGIIDFLSSDHSPCLPEMRHLTAGNFLDAWGGISGIQFNLASTWTEARKRGFSPFHLSKWWSEAPAKLSGVWCKKGSISKGKQADFVVWDANKETISDTAYHRHAGSPYVGMKLYGEVRHTFVAGREVFRFDEDVGARHFEESSCGRILHRE